MKDAIHAREVRYLNDPIFHALVDSMTAAALAHKLTVEDFIEAFRVVDVRVREEHLRRLSSGEE